jgi:hypothetical protein
MAAMTPPSLVLMSFCSLIGSPVMNEALAMAPESLVGASGSEALLINPEARPSDGHCCQRKSSALTESPRLMSRAATRTSTAPTVFST